MITGTEQSIVFYILPRAFGVLSLVSAFSSQTLSFEGYLYRYTELRNVLIQEKQTAFI